MTPPPGGGVDCYPLSPLQQGMLFHRLQGHAAGVDIEQVVCELHEEIDPASFDQAWREVMARHASLRTGYRWEAGDDPVQVVYPAGSVRLLLHHADFGRETEARRGLEEYLAADRREGFATLDAPLLRIALLRGGPARCWFVTTYHHLLLDARSMTVLFREVMELHDAFAHGKTLDLSPAQPYRGYIDFLQEQDFRRAEEFWRAHLRGFSAPTLLPIARRRGTDGNSRDARPAEGAGELAFRLPATATSALRTIAAKYDATLNTIVQAAWAIVLSRYTREEDVVFGAVRACRKIPVEGADSIVGLFINTVPVRVHAPADASIGPWLQELRQQWISLREYEHTPLTQIQQWSELNPGHALFDTIISFQEPAWDEALCALGGAWARRSFLIRAQPSYPLALEALAGSTLTVKFIYDHARFADEAIARLIGHYRVVLEALATDGVATLGSLPLLTTRELQLIARWNESAAEYPRQCCAHTLVETHAHHTPDAIAVTDDVTTLTYGELNARANRLAHRLIARGVAAEAAVAVCMDRSVEMIVAWLGVLKAGGAFVPIDPAYPAERIAFQLRDCGAGVVLTNSRRTELRLPTSGMDLIRIDASGGGFEEESERDPALYIQANQLAYVIYTSGSTGTPKGVEIEHRALMNLVTWHQRTYGVTPVDRATHLASPAFDAAVWEIWPYLAAGASVHIPDDDTRVSPARLWRWLEQKQISLSFLPTPLAEAAMAEEWPQAMALRAILTGGDTLKRRPPANFPCPLVNHYGPTENTVVTTCAIVRGKSSSELAPSIGKPISNTTVHVLDSHLQPMPVGVPGELFIGGESLARGYRGRPDLTREKFFSDPRDPSGATRLYRTGDLVRWNPEGELEFLGRVDAQVKIRGCRIELGEIEAALQQHPSARESIVLARTDERGEPRLVAYVLISDARASSPMELTEFLRAKLPSYMLPSAIVPVAAWPLTSNGKIDRTALPAPAVRTPEAETTTAPRTAVEAVVRKVWAEVLGRDDVSVRDNFFELGGHSLLAAQVVTRLNTTLSAAVSVRALFDQPTLSAFAREVERRIAPNAATSAPVNRMRRRTGRPELEILQPN